MAIFLSFVFQEGWRSGGEKVVWGVGDALQGHDDRARPGRLATGDIGRQLLNGDRFSWVQQVVHLPEGVLAVVIQCRLLLLLLLLVVLNLRRLIFVVRVVRIIRRRCCC